MAAHEDARHGQESEQAEHRHERPEDWGWHAESGRVARVFGLVVAVILVLMTLSTHQRHIEDIWLIGVAAGIIVMLIWDRQRRKHAWRE